jgi:hypothetical protein
MTQLRFRVGGLTHLDKFELQEQMARQVGDEGDAVVRFEEAPVREGAFGEPVTLIVVVGGIALKGLIAYLVLRNRQDHFKETIEVEYPDGRRVSHTVKCSIAKDRPVSDQIVEALSRVTDIPVPELTA